MPCSSPTVTGIVHRGAVDSASCAARERIGGCARPAFQRSPGLPEGRWWTRQTGKTTSFNTGDLSSTVENNAQGETLPPSGPGGCSRSGLRARRPPSVLARYHGFSDVIRAIARVAALDARLLGLDEVVRTVAQPSRTGL